MTIPKIWPKPIPRLFSDTKFSESVTETFFPIPNFPKPIPRLFFRYQIFQNWYRDFFTDTKFSKTDTKTFFSDTKFSETDTEALKKLAKVSKPRSFETEMSISGHEQSPKTSDLQRGIPRRLSGAFFALSWFVQLLNSHEQVRKTLMKSRLSPPGQQPLVCIDEAQVRVFLLSSSIIWSFNLGLRPSSWMGRLQD